MAEPNMLCICYIFEKIDQYVLCKLTRAELGTVLKSGRAELGPSQIWLFWRDFGFFPIFPIVPKLVLSRDPLQENFFFRIQTSQLYRNDPQHSLTIFDFLGEK